MKSFISRASRGNGSKWGFSRIVGQIVLTIAALSIAIPTIWVFIASFKVNFMEALGICQKVYIGKIMWMLS